MQTNTSASKWNLNLKISLASLVVVVILLLVKYPTVVASMTVHATDVYFVTEDGKTQNLKMATSGTATFEDAKLEPDVYMQTMPHFYWRSTDSASMLTLRDMYFPAGTGVMLMYNRDEDLLDVTLAGNEGKVFRGALRVSGGMLFNAQTQTYDTVSSTLNLGLSRKVSRERFALSFYKPLPLEWKHIGVSQISFTDDPPGNKEPVSSVQGGEIEILVGDHVIKKVEIKPDYEIIMKQEKTGVVHIATDSAGLLIRFSGTVSGIAVGAQSKTDLRPNCLEALFGDKGYLIGILSIIFPAVWPQIKRLFVK